MFAGSVSFSIAESVALPTLSNLIYSPLQADPRKIELLFSEKAPQPLSVFSMDKPPRLVFHFEPAVNAAERELLPASGGIVERIQVINHPNRESASLVVVQLKKPAKFETQIEGSHFVINLKDSPQARGQGVDDQGSGETGGVTKPSTVCIASDEPCECEPAFLAQRPDSFTLQLMSVRQYKSLEPWFRRYSEWGGCYYRYRSSTGKLWYAVVSGSFATRADAQRAIALLPESLRKAGPWPERLGQLQRRISESAMGRD